ncbi:hypothetical protein KC19_4G014400 [Ceratodon purpureus]|uniref:Prenylcysteine lyase domain-containing protein n=1 Tax=Ceratodon purpureus TaxID=3225 RepID=A0A8T0I5F0_CERPU|nr:hypothetical protein KC19_4G014400 [Ceratodon purpureus]
MMVKVVRMWGVLVMVLVVAVGLCDGEREVCVVGSGMGGASVAYFLREYAVEPVQISIFEEGGKVGGRMAVVELEGDTFEAGGSVIHPKNLHAVRFAELLGLNRTSDDDEESFGIWDGTRFVFQTARAGDSAFSKTITQIMNTVSVLWRYGISLWRMQNYVNGMLDKFLKLYGKDRPAFDSVEEMLKSVDLYNDTQYTLEELLLNAGLSRLLIDELITITMRINYGQNVSISGLAGGVSLAGAQGGLWAVVGGNWQLADGLIRHTNASLSLNHKVLSVTAVGDRYMLGSEGGTTTCDAVVIATSLDESKIIFTPSVKILERQMQHTYTTFVRGLLNSDYFGSTNEDIPELVATMEDPAIPFSSISVLKEYNTTDKAYKVFSRAPLSDELLGRLFSTYRSTIRIDWAAYPHYTAPEKFSPYVLDGNHLYYINTFESAASAIETAAVSAQNVARLLLSRLSEGGLRTATPKGVSEPRSE